MFYRASEKTSLRVQAQPAAVRVGRLPGEGTLTIQRQTDPLPKFQSAHCKPGLRYNLADYHG